MLGGHCLKTWSTTQAVVATSSGEAEFYAVVKGASMLLGMRALAGDLGLRFTSGDIKTDSSAAVGISHRTGLGKVRHLDVQLLWIQDRIKHGDFTLTKVPGSTNRADLLTKHLGEAKLIEFTNMFAMIFRSGRAESAPSIG